MSIVDPCVLKLLEHADSRYTLVVEAAKRGRQIVGGAQPMVEGSTLNPLKLAVEEIDKGFISYEMPSEEEQEE